MLLTGQLGKGSRGNTGDDELPGNARTTDFGTGAVVSAVSVGGAFACAVVSGTVKCVGDNQYGQLGQGNTDKLSAGIIPAQLPPIK